MPCSDSGRSSNFPSQNFSVSAPLLICNPVAWSVEILQKSFLTCNILLQWSPFASHTLSLSNPQPPSPQAYEFPNLIIRQGGLSILSANPEPWYMLGSPGPVLQHTCQLGTLFLCLLGTQACAWVPRPTPVCQPVSLTACQPTHLRPKHIYESLGLLCQLQLVVLVSCPECHVG